MEALHKPSQSHIVMVPSPGIGHLIPLLQFAKRLVSLQALSVTVAIPSDAPPTKPQKALFTNLPSTIQPLFLPLVSFHDLPKPTKIETIIALSVTRSLPFLRHLFQSLIGKTHLAALIVDHFSTDAFDVAIEFNVPRYLFFPPSAMSLSFAFQLPSLDQIVAGEFRDHPELIPIPGCIPIHGKDLLEPAQDREDDAYKLLLHNCKRYRLADAVFLNSFPELEPEAMKYLQEEEAGKPPVYPVGPLVRNDCSENENRAECLKWLDEQPNGSVLFVSFGSGGTLSSAQINELALGLEMSEQRFLWVVRKPNDEAANATFFSDQKEKEASRFLPEGFMERTKNRGMVVTSWAPQVEVLRHESTGGFLSHCGWNSTLEGVVNGVPLIAWPLYAEQRMNAHMLTEDIKVALRPKKKEGSGIVEKEEIAEVVKSLMEGEEGKRIREKMKNLKNAAERGVGEDGYSFKAVCEMGMKWKKMMMMSSQNGYELEEHQDFESSIASWGN
ncbi:hydroquinone glucosyltransferase-like [Cucurbita pepo subsp. pepo]|uniref:hydroquinone glucosyltransferase-like n=1 Tax=Cucurbita pepo subsp. pepo TaxID=3664 RepID=UPI000C9D269F|nr:hydroquinone glucosyltransferase-like [Cucurbita pepo subsp. pepo]